MLAARTSKIDAATPAEALARRLTDLGASVFMTVPPDGHPFLSFDFLILPAAPAASDLAALIRHRFNTEERFRKDLYGHLLAEDRVLQQIGHPNPLPRLEGLNAPTSPALASNR